MYTTLLVFLLRLQSLHSMSPEYFCFTMACEASSLNSGRCTTAKVSLSSTQLLVLVAPPLWLHAWHKLKLTISPVSDADKDDDDDDDDAITCDAAVDQELRVGLEGGWCSQEHCTEH